MVGAQERLLRRLSDDVAINHKDVDVATDKCVERLSRRRHYGLTAKVEARVQQHRHAGRLTEPTHGLVVKWIPFTAHSLQAARAHVIDSWNLSASLGADGGHHEHESFGVLLMRLR